MGVGTTEIALLRSVVLVKLHGGPEFLDDNRGCRRRWQVVKVSHHKCGDKANPKLGLSRISPYRAVWTQAPLPANSASLAHALAMMFMYAAQIGGFLADYDMSKGLTGQMWVQIVAGIYVVPRP